MSIPILVDYKSLQIISPEPEGAGGAALNSNFRYIADLLYLFQIDSQSLSTLTTEVQQLDAEVATATAQIGSLENQTADLLPLPAQVASLTSLVNSNLTLIDELTTTVQTISAEVANPAGGSNGQIQYNLSGQLKGSALLTFNSADGILQLDKRTIGTTDQAPALTITGIWNNGLTAFPAPLQINITDAGSEPGSLLLDLQIGGASQFRVDKSGTVTAGAYVGSGANLTSINANNINQGQILAALMGAGTANSASFLRGDQVWSSTLTGPLVVQPSTYPTSGNLITATGVWTSSSTRYGGSILVDVINNGSAAGSLLLDLQVGGVSQFSVDKAGNMVFAGTLSGSGSNLTSLNAANLTTGVVPAAALGSGTADSSTFLRGDGSWASVAIDAQALNQLQQQMDSLELALLPPSFNSFSIQGASGALEVGTTFAGGQMTFAWGVTNPGNAQGGSVQIADSTASQVLGISLPLNGTAQLSVASIANSTTASHTWTAQALDLNSGVFIHSFTINWLWRVYEGTSTNATLDAAGIVDLAASQLASSAAGTYSLAAGGYKYICLPTSLIQPAGFNDTSTGFNVPMASVGDNAAYSTVNTHGFGYATVSVTNGQGRTTNYAVYRTQNQLGGSLSLRVS